MRDHYRTLGARAEHSLKVQRSEFLAIALHVESEEEFFEELAAVAKRHFDATHHCWALRLLAGERARSSDAGEPSGTAGRPILAAIESAELFDAAVIVVRWFGGVKLGTGGLSRAYRESAAETLRHAQTVERYVYERIEVSVPFDRLGDAYRVVAPPDVLLASEDFGETYVFGFDVRLSCAAAFRTMLAEKRLQSLSRASARDQRNDRG